MPTATENVYSLSYMVGYETINQKKKRETTNSFFYPRRYFFILYAFKIVGMEKERDSGFLIWGRKNLIFSSFFPLLIQKDTENFADLINCLAVGHITNASTA